MSFRFFKIPVSHGAAAEEELNGFLQGHSVLAVEKTFVPAGENSFWAVCVDFRQHTPTTMGKAAASMAGRVDYKEVLSAEDFRVFARLRELRKKIAEDEKIPIYNVFTNEQLATVVTAHADTLAKLKAIDGIGEARAKKFGDKLLAEYAAAMAAPEAAHPPA